MPDNTDEKSARKRNQQQTFAPNRTNKCTRLRTLNYWGRIPVAVSLFRQIVLPYSIICINLITTNTLQCDIKFIIS